LNERRKAKGERRKEGRKALGEPVRQEGYGRWKGKGDGREKEWDERASTAFDSIASSSKVSPLS